MPEWAGGLAVAAMLLTLATGFGLMWRRWNGQLRSVGEAASGQVDGVHASGGALGNTETMHSTAPFDPAAGFDGQSESAPPGIAPALLAKLGVEQDVQVTLVQFSSAFCAPCRATRRICAEVAGLLDGVRHVEIDAESQLDLVRELDIRRTPTVLVIDSSGRLIRRAAGQPTKAHVIGAVAELLTDRGR